MENLQKYVKYSEKKISKKLAAFALHFDKLTTSPHANQISIFFETMKLKRYRKTHTIVPDPLVLCLCAINQRLSLLFSFQQ